jgi:hypothetical protein
MRRPRPTDERIGDMTASRRDFLATSAAVAAANFASFAPLAAAEPPQNRKPLRIASINSEYRFRSHAYHIGRRFLDGYDREGFHHQPAHRVVRMFNDKHPDNDLGPSESKQYGFELCDKVADALGGRGKLDVDAVLLIIEHGDYPTNDFGQVLYPRHELFMQVVAQFEAAGRSVPVFVDKHLSYDHRKAKEMVDAARRLKFGLLAGSSLPVTWRRPELDLPLDAPLKESLVAFGFDRGPSEIYFFHALEVLQCLMERRAGGESGVRRVTMLAGDDVWRAADDGRWSWELLDACLGRSPSCNTGDVRRNVKAPEAILVDYADGTSGAALNLIEQVSDFTFAARLEDRDAPVATLFDLPAPPGAKFFDALVWNIEKLFTTGRAPYPVERTLLTSTMLDFACRSRKEKKPLSSEFLNVRYRAPVDDGHARGRYTRDG